MKRTSIYLTGYILLFFCNSTIAAVLSCKSADGKTFFTDNPRKCGKQPVAEVQLDIPKQTRVNYRYPERLYDRSDSPWPIFIERPENEADKKVYDKAVSRLTKTLDMVFEKLPQSTHPKLKSVVFYIMRGPAHTLGGEEGGGRYIHNRLEQYSLHDDHWNNAVVIYSADSYLYHDDLVINHLIVHELAHAWHFLHWTYWYQPIIDTWLNSRNYGLYQSVKDHYGRQLNPAYATTNEFEYFADLSAMYFVGGLYFPFDKQGLAKYDPKGYKMIEKYWLIQKANP